MKNFRMIAVLLTVIALVFAVVGCATTQAAEKEDASTTTAKSIVESNVSVEAYPLIIRDWQDRNLGKPSKPKWLDLIVDGIDTQNGEGVADKWGIDTTEYRIVVGKGRATTRIGAETVANVEAPFALAAEIQSQVMGRLSAEGVDENNLNIVNKKAIQVNKSISGMRQITTFWQEVEDQDPAQARNPRYFVAYYVCTVPAEAWKAQVYDQMIQYMDDPDIAASVKQKIAAMWDDMDANANQEQKREDLKLGREFELKKQAEITQQTENALAAAQANASAARDNANVAIANAQAAGIEAEAAKNNAALSDNISKIETARSVSALMSRIF